MMANNLNNKNMVAISSNSETSLMLCALDVNMTITERHRLSKSDFIKKDVG